MNSITLDLIRYANIIIGMFGIYFSARLLFHMINQKDSIDKSKLTTYYALLVTFFFSVAWFLSNVFIYLFLNESPTLSVIIAFVRTFVGQGIVLAIMLLFWRVNNEK